MTNTSASRCGHCGAWLLSTDAVHYPLRRGEVDAGNPLLGTVVDGKYRLLSVLGRGGLGTVFRAQHIGSLMTVALKLLHPRFAERPEYRRALLPEARRAATVTHEHCARILDVGDDEGAVWLAMELVEGKTLDVVLRAGPLHPFWAVDILQQIAEALAAIHGVGLVHCDLSPRNVMVAKQGDELRVKVLDFGIARSVTLSGGGPQGEFAGFVNPAFAAPELLAGKPVDPRTDIWSFGILAWLLLTGDMPVDDTDPRRAAAAVRAGELRQWPGRPGLPRRLVRLVRRCVSIDPEARPASAADLGAELALVRGARRPALVRSAVVALAAGVLMTLASNRESTEPFLELVSGSQLVLVEGALGPNQPVQDLKSGLVTTLGFHFGGFAAQRLRADLVRGGHVLLGRALRPEVDAAAGTLTLSTAQAEWRAIVDGLREASPVGPIDVVFGAPGGPPLGALRVRLDDEPPVVSAEVPAAANRISATTTIQYTVRDDIEVEAVTAIWQRPGARTIEVPLPLTGGEFPLGEALAAKTSAVAATGPGTLVIAAVDRAENRGVSAPMTFAVCDVAAPAVLDVTGPFGEPWLPAVGGRIRLRLTVSAVEPGCQLQIVPEGRTGVALPLPEGSTTHTFEVDFGQPPANGAWQFVVEDANGNRTETTVAVIVHDRTVRAEIDADGRSACYWRNEVVVADQPAHFVARFGTAWRVTDVQLELASTAAGAPRDGGLRWRVPGTDGAANGPAPGVDVELQPLPVGNHLLHFRLIEGEGDGGLRSLHSVPLRVLPARIELRLPPARARFLLGLEKAGVLARRNESIVEGTEWRVDPALRPYLRGALRLRADRSIVRPIEPSATAGDPLLPPFVPSSGRNVLTVELTDVLGRPVDFVFGAGRSDGTAADRAAEFVAEFWWHDDAPEMVGEELLVEHGQPARVRVRCPLPFADEDLPGLRLDVAQSEIQASQVLTTGAAAIVGFEVPFAVWSVVAGLSDVPRDRYASQLAGSIDAKLWTPAGQWAMKLRLRTTRSTLLPVTLGEVRADLPPALRDLRLLPVLAPSGPFPEPLPLLAPPRATYRPHVAVAVRNLGDILLQDRELTWGQARALAAIAATLGAADRRSCVHHEDPLGLARLRQRHLLPATATAVADDATLTGVDFFTAWTLSRLLGVAVAGDATTFRLPLGCELELAAFGTASKPSCHGVGAHGGTVSMPAFLAAEAQQQRGQAGSAAESIAAGDVVPTEYGIAFVGLDFGVREWVLDLPHVPGGDALLREWIGDRDKHIEKVMELAAGTAEPRPDPVGPLREFGVVRGVALGQRSGLIDFRGAPLDPGAHSVVPDFVPGVLRAEQVQRDGSDLFAATADARLRWIGCRVVGNATRLTELRGQR